MDLQGSNFRQFPERGLDSYVAVEPNPYLHQTLRERAAEGGYPCIDVVVRMCAMSLEQCSGRVFTAAVVFFRLFFFCALPQNSTALEYLKNVPSSSLDGVVCTYFLCRAPEHRATLKEVVRVLKPGGRMFFVEPAKHGYRRYVRAHLLPLHPFC
jgi:SAM-dependent methyltransferase